MIRPMLNMRVFLALVLILPILAACGSVPKPFIKPGGAQAGWKNALVEPKGSYDIRVEPVEGPAIPMARLLARSVADELVKLEVPATVKASDVSRYVLTGKAEANWGDPRAPFVMLIRWTLADAKGEAVGDFTQGVQGSWFEWENGDPRVIRSVGHEAAQPFAKMVMKKEEILMPAELRGAALMVNQVTGAPGDGNQTLTDAMKEVLRRTDVSVTEDPRQMDFMLQGTVKLEAAEQGKQKVGLVWTVLTPAGGEVGKATQENTVPSGSLDGPWGKVANMVASAAVGGIESILARADRGGADGGGDSGKKLEMPPTLKQIPGRAPPPPQ